MLNSRTSNSNIANIKRLWIISLYILIVTISPSSLALENDHLQVIQIEAQQAEFNPDTGIAIYTGNVLMQQGSLKITADQVTIYQNSLKEVEKVIATAQSSPVHMQQQPKINEPLVHAYAQKIEYLAIEQEMFLQQNARLENGQDQFIGNQIRYHLQNRHIKAWGADSKAPQQTDAPQVKIILYPKTDIEQQSKAQ